jgi:hypothetical protein
MQRGVGETDDTPDHARVIIHIVTGRVRPEDMRVSAPATGTCRTGDHRVRSVWAGGRPATGT